MLQDILQWPKYSTSGDKGQYMRFQTPDNHVRLDAILTERFTLLYIAYI